MKTKEIINLLLTNYVIENNYNKELRIILPDNEDAYVEGMIIDDENISLFLRHEENEEND